MHAYEIVFLICNEFSLLHSNKLLFNYPWCSIFKLAIPTFFCMFKLQKESGQMKTQDSIVYVNDPKVVESQLEFLEEKESLLHHSLHLDACGK